MLISMELGLEGNRNGVGAYKMWGGIFLLNSFLKGFSEISTKEMGGGYGRRSEDQGGGTATTSARLNPKRAMRLVRISASR